MAVVVISGVSVSWELSECVLRIEALNRNQPCKTKLFCFTIHFYSYLEWLHTSNKRSALVVDVSMVYVSVVCIEVLKGS